MHAVTHHTNQKKQHWLITSTLILASALPNLSTVLADNAVAATSTDTHTSQIAGTKISGASSTSTNTATPPAKKPHRLIRRPPAKNTSATQLPSAELTPTAPLVTPPQENTPKQVKESSTDKSIAPTSIATPLASPIITQTLASPTPTASALIGSATPATRTAAAAPNSSSLSAPTTMRRLFAEIPGVAQITRYEDQDPSLTTPTISRNPAVLAFSAVQNGAAPAIQTMTISNSGPGTLAWIATSNATWLTLNNTTSATGNNLGTVSVGANPGGLSVGTHSGIITITAAGAANSPQTVTVTFDITAAPTPTIGLSATALSFSASQGGSNPANRTITISNSGSGTLNWTAHENATWLSVSPASGTNTGTITVSVNTAGMTAGIYNAPITIAATGATNTPQIVTVSLTLTAPTAIGFSPTSMGFTATQGSTNPASQTLTISNTGGGTLNWIVTDDATWLTPSPSSGTGSGSSTISITTTGLTPGSYSATITITASGATNTPRTIPVTLTLNAAPVISRTPTALTFTAVQGGTNPANQAITITNSGTGTLNWTASDNAAWLTVSPASGTGSGTLTASVNTSGLAAGAYTATITISATGASNTPQTMPISLTISMPATSTATLTWNANTETDLASYNVYKSTIPGIYGAVLANVPGGTTDYLATGLQTGTTYYFTITAVDSAGNESSFSNEVSKRIF